MCSCSICWHVSHLLVFWVFPREVLCLCWLLHLSSSKAWCGHFLTNFRLSFSSAWCYCVISSPISFLCLLSFFFVPAWGFVFVSGWGFAIWGFAFVSFMLKYLKFSCFHYYFCAFYLEFSSFCFFLLLISSTVEEFLFHAWLLCFTTNVVSFWKHGILFDFLHVWFPLSLSLSMFYALLFCDKKFSSEPKGIMRLFSLCAKCHLPLLKVEKFWLIGKNVF